MVLVYIPHTVCETKIIKLVIKIEIFSMKSIFIFVMGKVKIKLSMFEIKMAL